MLHLIHMHWLWVFGAFAAGIFVGWLTYLLAVTRWHERHVHIPIAAVAAGVLLVVAKIVPARYGARIEVGVYLALVGAIGCLVGWALRDLAEFVPGITASGATPAAAATGSYLFRDALAGTGAGSAFMRTGTGDRPTRTLMQPRARTRTRLVLGSGALVQAPAPGGYTFPETPPFADATTSRPTASTTGLRRHWSWPA